MLLDLHVHTAISPCSDLALDDILAHARSRGLDGVCITDHDSMDARHLLRRSVQDNGLLVIVGLEYATSQGDFLLFGPFEDLEPGLDAPSMLARVERAGGVAVAAHPCRLRRPVHIDLVAQGLVHAVETLNGRNTVEENRQAQDWAKRAHLPSVGGSDAHTLAELGRSPTRFFQPVSCLADLVAALRQGACAPARALGPLPLVKDGLPVSANQRTVARP
ncbi:MAG: PHP domain-containing protein [Desulfovibrio sp.]|nr:MAG: PHP domain-containing protein [Desulfovibrio sp.]